MLETIAQLVSRAKNCVVLTGAGISAESGVPTFRGKEGLWGKFRAEELATMDAFMANPEIVWEWYKWRRDLMGKVEPNAGHRAITELETICPNFTLITQNVDGLHRLAETHTILELHGNIYRNKCVVCERIFDEKIEIDPSNIPKCGCGGNIRPDVVWFGEMLDSYIINAAFNAAERADIFFSIGTSAIVHPAASLPVTAKQFGATLVEINREKTPLTPSADYFVAAKSGEWLPELVKAVKKEKKM